MFSLSYSESAGFGDAVVLTPLWLIAVLELYLTDFLKCTFSGEFNKNRAFFGGKKLKAATVYPARINQRAGPWKSGLRLRCLYLSPGNRSKLLASGIRQLRKAVWTGFYSLPFRVMSAGFARDFDQSAHPLAAEGLVTAARNCGLGQHRAFLRRPSVPGEL
jgi:hypothetical protein